VVALLAIGAAPAGARLLARVEPGWSPFVFAPVPAEHRSLAAEARGMLETDPGRIAEILSREAGARSGSARVLSGLRADALYFAGGDGVFEAQRAYRSLETQGLTPEEGAWVHLMLGNLHKGLGFDREAETEYRAAALGPAGPWRPALDFDLAALALETGRYGEARDALVAWLQAYPEQPGAPLALYLLGEAEAALGDGATAQLHFARARAADPAAWLARPESGLALVRVLRSEGRVEEAVALLDTLARDRAGTREAAQARLLTGELWESRGEIVQAARVYGALLDQGPTQEEGREALLRLALLGSEHADRVELTEPYPAYRVFYRPWPTLEEFVAGRDPLQAQRALRGLARLSRRDGRVEEALLQLSRAFLEYPESPESGRAYEGFVSTLEAHLAARLGAGAYVEVVGVYEALKKTVAWVPTRETGLLDLQAADAYAALGAPVLAGEIYERLLARGTSALSSADLRRRLNDTRAAQGDLDALRRQAGAAPHWPASLALARALARTGDRDRARRAYLDAARLAPGAQEKAAAWEEADALLLPGATNQELWQALVQRREGWQGLAAGEERVAQEARDRLLAARLRFVLGDEDGAARLYRELGDLGPEDRYVQAIAEKRAGHGERAAALLGNLAEDGGALFGGLARLHLEVDQMLGRSGQRP